jgi:hypothetical protein
MWTDDLPIIELKQLPTLNEAVIDRWQGRDMQTLFKRVQQSAKANLRSTLKTLLPKRPREVVRGIAYFDVCEIMPDTYAVADWAYFHTDVATGFVSFNVALVTTIQAMWLMNIIPNHTLRYGVPSLAWDWSKDIPWGDEKIAGMPSVMKASEK